MINNEINNEMTERLRSTEPTFITRIRLRAQRRILWLRRLWHNGQLEGEQGLAITHQEVDRIVAGPAQDSKDESSFYETDHLARQLSQRIHVIDQWVANEEVYERLLGEFALSPEEFDLLTLVVAVEIDPLLRRVYGYLQDDASACYPTPWLAAQLFQWHTPVRFSIDSALVRWRMAYPLENVPNPWGMNAMWVADPYIVSWLLHEDASSVQDPRLGMLAHMIAPEQDDKQFVLYPEQLSSMQAFVQTLQHRREAIELTLIAPEGAGKYTLARQFCAQSGRRMLVVDAAALFNAETALPVLIERAIHAVRMARLTDAVLYWHKADAVDTRVWQAIQGEVNLAIFGTSTPMAQPKSRGVVRKSLHLPLLTHSRRVALWRHLSSAPVPEQVKAWVLTAAEIVGAVQVVPAGDEAVAEACRQVLTQGPGELFTPLPCPFTWDDIILAPSVRQQLGELENQARLRWFVYEEWGFERLFALGRGVTALFTGPSGTGKTMAAQVLARSLSMDLYRVDLAGVMSKYIGETEKRLKEIFDICERANVLLFFDEADALFGQRTQVKDAHDRFANIEIDYLLQRMEQFDGIAILATNRKGDMDSAFLRRLRFIIDFMQPGPTERLTLWHIALPQESPRGEPLLDGIDWASLATRLNMTGADIKSAALSAAFLARAEGTKIAMKHVLYAARREMAKHGVVLRTGDWG